MDIKTGDNWPAFRDCLVKNVSTVEQVIPSLDEGADFIAEALCESETGRLQQEVSQKLYESLTGETEFDEGAYREIKPFIDSVPFLIRRAARISIFATRRQRLGL